MFFFMGPTLIQTLQINEMTHLNVVTRLDMVIKVIYDVVPKNIQFIVMEVCKLDFSHGAHLG